MSKTSPKRVAAAPPPAGLPDEIARAVEAAAAKKAEDIVVLDLREAAGFTDYFLICTGGNPRQIKAIADAIEEALAAGQVKPAHVEGYQRAEWVLLDYFDFVVHVFTAETRAFYSLERLWGSATPVDLHDLAGAPDRR
jgi:ribosome-associated protein